MCFSSYLATELSRFIVKGTRKVENYSERVACKLHPIQFSISFIFTKSFRKYIKCFVVRFWINKTTVSFATIGKNTWLLRRNVLCITEIKELLKIRNDIKIAVILIKKMRWYITWLLSSKACSRYDYNVHLWENTYSKS